MNLINIVFPCISTGIYGFDKNKACEIAYKTVSKFIDKNKDIKVIFNVFDKENYLLYKNKLEKENDN